MSKADSAPKLDDVARRAGVSPASVSRGLNNVGPTSGAMRDAVRRAASEIGYLPRRPRASSLRRLLAVITPDLLNPYFNEIIRGIEERATTTGLVTSVMEALPGMHIAETAAEWVRAQKARGAIVFGGVLSGEEVRCLASASDVPVVAINQVMAADRDVLCINIDYVQAMHQATAHLLELGHRRIAFVTSSAHSATSAEKMRGIRQALSQRGLSLLEEDVLPGAATVDWGFQAMSSLLSRPAGERPTAVIGACDLIALGVLHAVRSWQLSVPRDVSVIGFDDIAMACHANPPLTTISPPKQKMGRLAIDLILRSPAEGPSAVSSFIMLESPLVVRESTARVAE